MDGQVQQVGGPLESEDALKQEIKRLEEKVSSLANNYTKWSSIECHVYRILNYIVLWLAPILSGLLTGLAGYNVTNPTTGATHAGQAIAAPGEGIMPVQHQAGLEQARSSSVILAFGLLLLALTGLNSSLKPERNFQYAASFRGEFRLFAEHFTGDLASLRVEHKGREDMDAVIFQYLKHKNGVLENLIKAWAASEEPPMESPFLPVPQGQKRGGEPN